ncbi:MAG: glutamate--cysteine ligase [Planctomycetota bacterium]|nr:MAG: glutamate--cysteine ligase [Planctomycetota bacterium]
MSEPGLPAAAGGWGQPPAEDTAGAGKPGDVAGPPQRLGLFQAVGIECEYMIVEADTLEVLPVADRVLEAVAGALECEVEVGPLRWSNELVLHVIELKLAEPTPSLARMLPAFEQHVRRIGALLAPLGGRLLPGGMHPWMDPRTQTRLWPHEYSAVYEAFHRIFDCRAHGWANLQSTHLNLPFADDAEFGRLHAAVRLVLPILPALAASSPIWEGRRAPSLDQRLEVYRTNARRVASVMGAVIPEPVFTEADYHEQVLRPIYRDIAPLDPDGTLQHEWLNARGAIARFSRGSIEVRLLDVQECPRADLAIAELVVRVLRALVEQRWVEFGEQRRWPVERLVPIFLACVREAEQARIDDVEYLRVFGLQSARGVRAGELWQHLAELVLPPGRPGSEPWRPALETILTRGPLARRILAALGEGEPSRERLRAVYRQLAECLEQGRMFVPAG